jgi:hypothetical protein
MTIPVVSIPLVLMSSDYSKGIFPDWVYTLSVINYVLMLAGVVVYFSLTT